MSPQDAARALARWPDLEILAAELIAQWPVPAFGPHRLVFPDWRVTLTLFIGDAEDWLNTMDFQADAWFLDGFAPAKNDTMWAEALYPLMARHSKRERGSAPIPLLALSGADWQRPVSPLPRRQALAVSVNGSKRAGPEQRKRANPTCH